MNTQEIFDRALQLPLDERCQLLEALQLSVPEKTSDTDIDSAWLAVAEQRLANFDSAQTKAIHRDAVFSDIHQLLS